MRRILAVVALSILVGCNEQTTCCSFVPTPITTNPPYATGSKVLPIAPVAQQTAEWCWLASAQMIFQYFGVPPVNGISYQCGIMGAVAGPTSICFYNCAACVFGSGSDANSALVLQAYPAILQTYFFPSVKIPQIRATLMGRRINQAEIEQQINSAKPVELGITVGGPFQGQAGHDVVLVGYDAPDTSTFNVIIDDPFPYDLVVGPAQNPYYQSGGRALQAGQYELPYQAAVVGLQWSDSIEVTTY